MEKDGSETDRYGRLLRYVYLEDGRMLNELSGLTPRAGAERDGGRELGATFQPAATAGLLVGELDVEYLR